MRPNYSVKCFQASYKRNEHKSISLSNMCTFKKESFYCNILCAASCVFVWHLQCHTSALFTFKMLVFSFYLQTEDKITMSLKKLHRQWYVLMLTCEKCFYLLQNLKQDLNWQICQWRVQYLLEHWTFVCSFFGQLLSQLERPL